MRQSATAIEVSGLFPVDGNRVRELRQAKGLTQLELSLRADLMQSAISRLESGLTKRVQWSTLERLARVFDLPIEKIQGG